MGSHRDRVALYFQEVNAGNSEGAYDALKSFVRSDVLVELPDVTYTTLEEIWQLELEYFALSDLDITVTWDVETEEAYVFELMFRASHSTPFPVTEEYSLPPTGRPIEWRLIEVMEFDAEGMVSKWRAYWDQLTLMAQMGMTLPSGATHIA